MKSLLFVNILGCLGFGICAGFSLNKVFILERFISASKTELLQGSLLAFRACSDAWSALAACAGVAFLFAAINFWVILANQRGLEENPGTGK